MTTKTKKTIGIALSVIVALIIVFAVFLYIGKACKLSVAVEICNYISAHRSELVTLCLVTVIPTAMKYINQLNNKNSVILENIGAVKDGLTEKLEYASSQIQELKEQIQPTEAIATDIQSLFGNITELKEREKTITDILLYYVLGNSGNSDIESLKLALQQSELLKNIRALESVEKETLDEPTKETVEKTLMSAKMAVKRANKKVAL